MLKIEDRVLIKDTVITDNPIFGIVKNVYPGDPENIVIVETENETIKKRESDLLYVKENDDAITEQDISDALDRIIADNPFKDHVHKEVFLLMGNYIVTHLKQELFGEKAEND